MLMLVMTCFHITRGIRKEKKRKEEKKREEKVVLVIKESHGDTNPLGSHLNKIAGQWKWLVWNSLRAQGFFFFFR